MYIFYILFFRVRLLFAKSNWEECLQPSFRCCSWFFRTCHAVRRALPTSHCSCVVWSLDVGRANIATMQTNRCPRALSQDSKCRGVTSFIINSKKFKRILVHSYEAHLAYVVRLFDASCSYVFLKAKARTFLTLAIFFKFRALPTRRDISICFNQRGLLLASLLAMAPEAGAAVGHGLFSLRRMPSPNKVRGMPPEPTSSDNGARPSNQQNQNPEFGWRRKCLSKQNHGGGHGAPLHTMKRDRTCLHFSSAAVWTRKAYSKRVGACMALWLA